MVLKLVVMSQHQMLHFPRANSQLIHIRLIRMPAVLLIPTWCGRLMLLQASTNYNVAKVNTSSCVVLPNERHGSAT
jgi:hypothetical protein